MESKLVSSQIKKNRAWNIKLGSYRYLYQKKLKLVKLKLGAMKRSLIEGKRTMNEERKNVAFPYKLTGK